jgi:hypothetical protein
MACLTLLYSTWFSCMIYGGFKANECNPQKDFRPIYTMWDCGVCNRETDLLIQMEEMVEPKYRMSEGR